MPFVIITDCINIEICLRGGGGGGGGGFRPIILEILILRYNQMI